MLYHLLQALLLRRCADVAAGMSYLHAHKVCHGDLKLDNVLLRSGQGLYSTSISRQLQCMYCTFCRHAVQPNETASKHGKAVFHIDLQAGHPRAVAGSCEVSQLCEVMVHVLVCPCCMQNHKTLTG